MSRNILLAVLALLLSPWCVAQLEPTQSGRGQAPQGQAPPRSDDSASSSSSKDRPVGIAPPANDADHPGADAADVGEFKKYDPHRAAKDAEVAEYYAKQGNHRAALWRYQDALEYMPNDPTVIYKLAETYDRLEQPQPAARHIVLYLRLAPEGEFVEAAKKLQQRLRPVILALAKTPGQKQAFALVDEGAVLLSRHEFRGAIAKFQSALEADPKNEDATFFLADAYQQNGLMDEAGATYRSYLRLSPGGVFADSARIALQHLPALRGEGIPAKPDLPTSQPSESPR
ncbi:MAG: tetratricopeptide repeat protein [Candidatus Koribacter versatilis]|uniref:Tetratricopeptide repeat protein n=1 Tax=Candidatus Korobacter versatilis TaxID=658062 RepID=A0A932A622_9BACT|nr:tetratricopeptide repeat protein [Candidatus Koribacter versatilis]